MVYILNFAKNKLNKVFPFFWFYISFFILRQ